jgi:hypothetical protein
MGRYTINNNYAKHEFFLKFPRHRTSTRSIKLLVLQHSAAANEASGQRLVQHTTATDGEPNDEFRKWRGCE